MDDTGSFLFTVIDRVRGFLDDPDAEAKYNNSWMVRHLVMPAMVEVIGLVNMGNANPIVASIDIELEDGVSEYQLPPCLGEVWRVVQLDTDGNVASDWVPRHAWHPCGDGWRIEGNVLKFVPAPTAGETWTVQFVTNGDVLCHYATDGTLDATKSIVTLSAAPALGQLDRRPEGYRGSVLRLLPQSGAIEERIIASHDVSAGTVTVRRPFTYASAGTVRYEIAPQQGQALYELIAARASIKLATIRETTQSKYARLTNEFRAAKKTLVDNLANVQARTGMPLLKDTTDAGWDL